MSAAVKRPALLINIPGGRFGGPIIKNKLFYFGSFENSTDRRFAGALQTVPTAMMRTGNLSTSTLPIYDPNTGAANGTASARASNCSLTTARRSSFFPPNHVWTNPWLTSAKRAMSRTPTSENGFSRMSCLAAWISRRSPSARDIGDRRFGAAFFSAGFFVGTSKPYSY